VRQHLNSKTWRDALEFIRTGNKDMPVSRKSLAKEFGSDRTARRLVEEARRKGYGIISNRKGYFVTTNPRIMEKFVTDRMKKIESEIITLVEMSRKCGRVEYARDYIKYLMMAIEEEKYDDEDCDTY